MSPTAQISETPVGAENEAATARLASFARRLGEGVAVDGAYRVPALAFLGRSSDFLSQQAEKLLVLAARHKVILPADVFKNIKPISADTGEVVVYPSPREDDRVYKVTKGVDFFGYTIRFGKLSLLPRVLLRSTPAEYLERLALANRLFGDDNRFEGVTVDKQGHPHIVTSQRYFAPSDDRPIQSEEMRQFMIRKGFRPIPQYDLRGSRPLDRIVRLTKIRRLRRYIKPRASWYRPLDGVIADDAYEGNFQRKKNGEIFPIDLRLHQVNPQKFRDWGWESAPQSPRFPSFVPGLRRLLHREAAEVGGIVQQA